MATRKKVTAKKEETIALPAGIKAADLKWRYRPGVHWEGSFEIINTERFGWCIATLHIRNAGRRSGDLARQAGARTYATTLDGETVTVGLGPHVRRRETVYVDTKNKARLQKYLDLQASGAVRANEIRDSISTRRARTSARRFWY